jgi:5-methylcytosine-specific restriction protein A
MPRHRQPKEIWDENRIKILSRDGFRCTRCGTPVTTNTGHTDHIRSGKLANNQLAGLRTLCRHCHVLRADKRHRGMIAGALRDGIIGPDWREHVWEDE